MKLEFYLFIGIFFVVLLVPCLGISIIGYKMINKLGYYPSKTPAIQLSILFKLIAIEVASLTLLLIFFQIFAQ